uniref:Uncharacterized protein n=1 Tax=Romanomermis culicivorax TaxID=13658 RepID=A0A915KY24_ROMCU
MLLLLCGDPIKKPCGCGGGTAVVPPITGVGLAATPSIVASILLDFRCGGTIFEASAAAVGDWAAAAPMAVDDEQFVADMKSQIRPIKRGEKKEKLKQSWRKSQFFCSFLQHQMDQKAAGNVAHDSPGLVQDLGRGPTGAGVAAWFGRRHLPAQKQRVAHGAARPFHYRRSGVRVQRRRQRFPMNQAA